MGKYPDKKPKSLVEPMKADWVRSNGTYIAGQASIDELDVLASGMEAHWGCDRLRTLVGVELREKFDRQRYLTNQAIWQGDLEAVRRECARMMAGWRALDKAAREAGNRRLSPEVWEIALPDGRVLALCRTIDDARSYDAGGRSAVVWSLDEVARVVAGQVFVADVKREFPGARVVAVRGHVGDPLIGVDAVGDLDDEIPF